MGRNEWQPIPLPAPDLPNEPPPDRYPKKKAPEMDDHPRLDEKHRKTNGSTVINGSDPREYNPFDDKIKSNDDM